MPAQVSALVSGPNATGTARVVIDTSWISQNAHSGVAVLESAQAIVRDSELASSLTNGVLLGGEAAITLERNGISGSAAGVRLESRGVAQGTENTFSAVGVEVDDAR